MSRQGSKGFGWRLSQAVITSIWGAKASNTARHTQPEMQSLPTLKVSLRYERVVGACYLPREDSRGLDVAQGRFRGAPPYIAHQGLVIPTISRGPGCESTPERMAAVALSWQSGALQDVAQKRDHAVRMQPLRSDIPPAINTSEYWPFAATTVRSTFVGWAQKTPSSLSTVSL